MSLRTPVQRTPINLGLLTKAVVAFDPSSQRTLDMAAVGMAWGLRPFQDLAAGH